MRAWQGRCSNLWMNSSGRTIRLGLSTPLLKSWIWHYWIFQRRAGGDRPPLVSPATLLKIYLYRYLNQVQSSRRLERKARRNLEVMWLTGRLTPDFKTIADFSSRQRFGDKGGVQPVVALCRRLDLLTHAVIAVDAANSRR
jgi:transposase